MTGKINSNLNNQISLQSAESLDTNTQVRKQSLPLSDTSVKSKKSRLHKDRSSKSSSHLSTVAPTVTGMNVSTPFAVYGAPSAAQKPQAEF